MNLSRRVLVFGLILGLVAGPALGQLIINRQGPGGSSPIAAPVNLTLPVVTGIGQFGQDLTCSDGTWSNSPTTITRQWYRNTNLISLATNTTYHLILSDIAQQIFCKVTASNTGGSATSSNALPNFGIFTSTLGGATPVTLYTLPQQQANHAHINPANTTAAFSVYNANAQNPTQPFIEGASYLNTQINSQNLSTLATSVTIPADPANSNANPAWGPDSSYFIFSTSAGGGHHGAGKYTVATNNINYGFYVPTDIDCADFSVNASGDIAMGCTQNTNIGAIFVLHSGTRYQVTNPVLPQLSGSSPGDTDPEWNHAGNAIAFPRHLATGIFDVVVASVATSAPFTNNGETVILPPAGLSASAFSGVPEFSSDDAKIITWVTDPQNRYNSGLYYINSDGSGSWTRVNLPAEFIYNTVAWGPGGGSSSSAPIIYSGTNQPIFDTPPVNTVLPVISGTPQVGLNLTVSTGTWTSNSAIHSYTYQWYGEGTALVGHGATTNTYTLQTTDIGSLMTCQVTANNAGNSVPALTATFGTVFGATVRYVSSSTGNDSNAGTLAAPWQTIAKVNAQNFSAGTSVLFKRGDVWIINDFGDSQLSTNQSHSNGSVGNPVVFDAYGTGANPILQGSFDASDTGASAHGWTSLGSNLWQSNQAFPPATSNGLPDNNANDIGNIIWITGGVTQTGVEVGNLAAGHALPLPAPPALQGQWQFIGNDPADGCVAASPPPCWTVKVFSTTNPASAMPGLQLTQDKMVIIAFQAHDEIFQDFTIQYAGGSGVDFFGSSGTPGSNLTLRDSSIQWIGGGNLGGGGTRYGDALNLSGTVKGSVIERNTFNQAYDVGIAPQTFSPFGDNSNNTFRNNIVSNAETLSAIDYRPGSGSNTANNILYYNNTNWNASSWSNGQRTNGNTNFGWYHRKDAFVAATGTAVENNIISKMVGCAVLQSTATEWQGNITQDYNNYKFDGAGTTTFCPIVSGSNQSVAAWTASLTPPIEVHGLIDVDPDFTSPSTGDFTPAPGSPLFNAGANLYYSGVVWDINHLPRPLNGPFTIGAIQ